jgi:hypothetical protein
MPITDCNTIFKKRFKRSLGARYKCASYDGWDYLYFIPLLVLWNRTKNEELDLIKPLV